MCKSKYCFINRNLYLLNRKAENCTKYILYNFKWNFIISIKLIILLICVIHNYSILAVLLAQKNKEEL